MADTTELSEAKRALLEKYLRGDLPQAAAAVETVRQRTPRNPAPLSDTNSRAPLSVVQSGGSRRPFFYLHVHWVGGAFYCFPLARDLGADQPFYVLEPYKFDDLEVLPTLETMAAAYVEALRAIQPEGPYLLGGFCGGGLIAFEIAQQLHAQGQVVDLLVLIEPRAGPTILRMLGPRLVGGFIRSIGKLIRLSPHKQLDCFLCIRHWYLFLRYPQYRNAPTVSLAPNFDVLRQDWINKFVWVISGYFPRRYPGKATYFWADEKLGSRKAGWGKGAKAEEVEVQIIPGTHDTCRTDHLHGLAEHLSTCLSKAQGAASG